MYVQKQVKLDVPLRPRHIKFDLLSVAAWLYPLNINWKHASCCHYGSCFSNFSLYKAMYQI